MHFLTIEYAVPHLKKQGGSVAACASIVLFLASDASRHITGTEVWIDGSQSLLQG